MAVAATGFFDGVHLGHKAVLSRLVALARETGEESMVVSFWPHPRTVLQDGALGFRLLTTLEEKEARIRDLGVDRFVVLPFTRDFAARSTYDFVKHCLMEDLGVRALLVGYDHRLGHDEVHGLAQLQSKLGGLDLRLEEIPPQRLVPGEATAVSSTQIRTALATGCLDRANAMLGYAYSLTGTVVEGNRRGRSLGYPTANMQLREPLKQLPSDGVYATRVEVLGRTYAGMTNIGWRPTLHDARGRTIETYILGFDQDIYGLDLRLSFHACLRCEKTFASLSALTAQLQRDERAVSHFFNL